MASKRVASLIVGASLLSHGVAADAAGTLRPVLTGTWGGPQIQLALRADGGEIALACAAVHIGEDVHIDSGGNFSAGGQYEAFAGGQAPADQPLLLTPVRVSGHVDGETLLLSIQRAAVATETHSLTQGRRTKLLRCQ